MTRKSNKKLASLEKKLASLQVTQKQKKKPQQPKKKPTPFQDVGATLGRSVGSMFGNAGIGSGIGRWLGQGIGSIFGSGDYTLAGPKPDYNVLVNGSQIPQFSTTHSTNIICHREYLGDITGTSAFNNTAYPLNPGMFQTFPWLSTVAQNFQEYRFHGVTFEFRSLITDYVTNGAPGVVVMSTNYNADVPTYMTKQQMENAEYAVSVKPTRDLMHGIECAIDQTILPHRYVRTGSVPAGQDLRLYDYGNFQFATQSNPTSDLGALWVSYCVEFMKPVLPTTDGGTVQSVHFNRSGGSGTNPLGTATVTTSGSLATTIGATNALWTATPNSQYLITIDWAGTNATISFPGFTFSSNFTLVKLWSNNTSQFGDGYGGGLSTGTCSVQFIVKENAGILASGFFAIGSTGTLPTSSAVDIYITQLDNSVNI